MRYWGVKATARHDGSGTPNRETLEQAVKNVGGSNLVAAAGNDGQTYEIAFRLEADEEFPFETAAKVVKTVFGDATLGAVMEIEPYASV